GDDRIGRGRVPPGGDLAAARSRSRVSERVLLRLRVGAEQAHYGGGLVDGAFVLKLFGDAATELLIRRDGDEGLFRAYSSVDFLAPVLAGDYLEIEAEITRVGKSSRDLRFEARKVITPGGGAASSSARLLEPPIVVARAAGTCVVPAQRQRPRSRATRFSSPSRAWARRSRASSSLACPSCRRKSQTSIAERTMRARRSRIFTEGALTVRRLRTSRPSGPTPKRSAGSARSSSSSRPEAP